MTKEKKKDFFEKVANHLGKALIISMIIIFVVPFVLVGILKLVSMLPGDCLTLSGNNQTWFGFYGSYMGCFLTLILTFFTIKLTVKIQERSEAESERQHAFSVATNMPNFSDIKGELFYIEEMQPIQFARYFEDNKAYIFEINMEPAFPPYFSVEINKIELEWFDLSAQNRGQRITATQEIKKECYHIINNDKTQLLFQLDVEKDTDLATILKQFYYYQHMTTEYTTQQYEILKLSIYMSCRNVLVRKQDLRECVRFSYHIDIKNGGKDDTLGGMSICVENRMMEYQEQEIK